MKYILSVALAIFLIALFAFSANAEMIAKGSCTAESRKGWAITESNIDSVSMWIEPAEDDKFYSHISGCETYFDAYGYNEITIAYAVTLDDGSILTEKELFEYLEWLVYEECMSLKTLISFDAKQYGIIEGVFIGENQIAEAEAFTIEIHEQKEAEK